MTDVVKKFMALREYVFKQIEEKLNDQDSSHKSYEGTFTLSQSWPNYFEYKSDHAIWILRLDCYVLGPHRHYEWEGNTAEEVVDKADKEIRAWFITEEQCDCECHNDTNTIFCSCYHEEDNLGRKEVPSPSETGDGLSEKVQKGD